MALMGGILNGGNIENNLEYQWLGRKLRMVAKINGVTKGTPTHE